MIYHYDKATDVERMFNSDAVAMVDMNHVSGALTIWFTTGSTIIARGDEAAVLWAALKKEFDTIEWLDRGGS